MAQYETANTIISDSAVELGLVSSPITNPFASPDPNILQLCALLKTVGRRLRNAHDWSQLRFSVVQQLSIATAIYDLPLGFDRLVHNGVWNSTQQRPIFPATPAEWAMLRNTASSLLQPPYRLEGNKLVFYIEPPAADDIDIAYLTYYWVSTDNAASVPSTDVPADTLYCWFDSHLLICALKLAFKRAKQMDSAAEQQDYEDAFAASTGANDAARTLRMAGRTRPHFIDASNLPETGYGS